MRRLLLLLPGALLLTLTGLASSATIHVPGGYPTIQEGIDTAAPGDTVLVAAGTYTGPGNHDLDFGGVDLVLLSEAGPESTQIHVQGNEGDSHRGFYFHSGETPDAIVEGFTIQGGYVDDTVPSPGRGAGAMCEVGSTPTFLGCVFHENHVSHSTEPGEGRGIRCGDGLTIYGCTNSVCHDGGPYGGGGCKGNPSLIKNCTFVGNTSKVHGTAIQGSGGAYLSDAFPYPCEGNVIAGNSAVECGGMTITLEAQVLDLHNMLIALNESDSAAVCIGYYPGQATFYCSDIYGNTGGDWVGELADQLGVNGNFSLDPLFLRSRGG